MQNYYTNTAFVSNSDLGAFKDFLNLSPQRDLSKAYAIGSLVDAFITERERVNEAEKSLDGTLFFDDETWDKAQGMNYAGQQDKVLQYMVAGCQMQEEVYNPAFEVTYNGEAITLPARGKLDFRRRAARLGADLKTTACETLPSFIQSISMFDYDRQGAWYMDIDPKYPLDRFIFIAISKKKKRNTYPVFKYAIQRGDAMYLKGKAKYSYLAYQYKHKILSLYGV